MQEDIGGGFEEGAVFDESERFKSEGRVGGEATKYSDEEKDTDVWSEQGSGFCQSMKEAD